MWEAIRSNRRRSRIIVAGMAALLFLLGAVLGNAVVPRTGFVAGAALALAVWLGLWLVARFEGDRIMLLIAGAQRISKPDAPQLFNVVEEMVIASGLGRLPDIYVLPDDRPNAFAIGRTADSRAVCVTSGLLRIMNRDELQGVIAHEIGHHKNGDPALMVLLGVMLGAIVLLADVFLRSGITGGRRSSRDREDAGGLQIVLVVLAIVLAVLAPVLAQMMYFACSRRREYLADASAARFTRYPEGLASALEKISVSVGEHRKVNQVLAPMYIVNPMEALAAVGLFSTHPPTEDRIRILRSMGGGAGYVDYEAAFRKVTGRPGCIGRRTLAEDPAVQARAASAEAAPAREETVRRSREVGDLVARLDGLTRLQCPCGVGIKVPAGAAWSSIPCPRCGRDNPVPKAQTADRPEAPLRFSRRPEGGWQSFQCTCGASLHLSPEFQGSSLACQRCGRTIQIV